MGIRAINNTIAIELELNRWHRDLGARVLDRIGGCGLAGLAAVCGPKAAMVVWIERVCGRWREGGRRRRGETARWTTSTKKIRVLMIIKGLCKRYERWNPVHPTSGAFWGMGIGIGCGVGWGPGFGPDVVGYVGAGCGIGFNVGITFAGIGIGLPTNVVLGAPYNVLLATKNSMVEAARSSGLLPMGHVTGGSLSDGGSPHVSEFQKSELDSLSKRATVGIPRNMLSSHVKPVFEGLNTLMKKLSEHQQGAKD